MTVATKKEWLAQGWKAVQEEPYKYDRWVIVPRLVALLVGTIMLVAGMTYAYAEPIVMASNGKVTITVYSEPCSFPDHVTNLPIRATWNEGGKVIEGCAGRDAENGIAVFWFSDKTVFTLSLSAFVKVTGV